MDNAGAGEELGQGWDGREGGLDLGHFSFLPSASKILSEQPQSSQRAADSWKRLPLSLTPGARRQADDRCPKYRQAGLSPPLRGERGVTVRCRRRLCHPWEGKVAGTAAIWESGSLRDSMLQERNQALCGHPQGLG